MRSLKRLPGIILGVLLLSLLAACGSNATSSDPNTLTVGASVTPHAEILKYIKDNLAEKEGLKLNIVTFNDYVQPNMALKEGSLNANFFQHVPYMEDFGKQHGIDMVAVTKVLIEPLGLYSKKVKSLDAIGNGATIAIPNDVTNGGRALQLLAENKLIGLKPGVGTSATVRDIVSNPKNIKITELEAAQLPRSLEDTTASIINGNYAMTINLKPNKDALILESATNNPYANVLTVLKGHENDPAVKKLAKLLNTPEVKKFILDKYEGAVIPAF
ncbi:MetQ/NlpA family ABC transporter substrate-binding protein [Ktedonospora formicarum]|uniref:Lipoprotein n=1 Tax=Ktedonospora formicarum TaxID=2778364 RepID=A0A8J3IBL2_9CHLR|nr:MetQ/NlpA family ABC transporter substrate-binding protein [Ktedonospora formicarum]GHO49308.1 lipoprotein [Ktedonospora formicarum]